MKLDIKEASITYFIWCLLSYLLGSFYCWDFVAKNWDTDTRNLVVLFGPVFGVFIFLLVLFWDQAVKESHEIE